MESPLVIDINLNLRCRRFRDNVTLLLVGSPERFWFCCRKKTADITGEKVANMVRLNLAILCHVLCLPTHVAVKDK